MRKHLPAALIYIALAVAFCAAAVPEYYNFRFAADGFTDYSILRNFVDRRSLWEGPGLEYVLATHSYWTLYLLAPLVAIFRSPLVLLMVSIASHFTAAFLIYLIAVRRFEDRFIAALFSFLYFLFPISYGQVFGREYLFQPDYMMPVFVLCMALLVLGNMEAKDKTDGQSLIFYIFLSLFLATKEEYIPVGIVVYAWLAFGEYYLYGKRTLADRGTLKIAGIIFLVFAVVDVVSRSYFSSLNHYSFVWPPVRRLLFEADTWKIIFRTVAEILLPVSPVILAAAVASRALGKVFLLLSLIVFVLFRVAGSYLFIYFPWSAVPHWANIIIPATVVPTLIMVFSYNKRLSKAYKSLIVVSLLLSMGLCILYNQTGVDGFTHPNGYDKKAKINSWRSAIRFDGIGFTNSILEYGLKSYITPPSPNILDQELIYISKQLPPTDRSRLEVVALPDHAQWPFMERSCFVSKGLLKIPLDRLKYVLENVDWIIIHREDLTSMELFVTGREVYLATPNFVVFKGLHYRSQGQASKPYWED